MPTVIHTYLTRFKFQPMPFGFADWLRGTLVLYERSRKHKYTLLIDYSHPLLQLFKDPKTYGDSYVNEIILPIYFPTQDLMIEKLFSTGRNFTISTHILPEGFYTTPLSTEVKTFLKNFLVFNDSINEKIANTRNRINDDFVTVHLRSGDNFLVNGVQHPSYDKIYNRAKNVISQQTKPVLVIGDNKHMINELSKELTFFQTDSNPSHSGVCKNNLEGVLVDFGIMPFSKKIYCVTEIGSGFSDLCARIYDIPFTFENV